MLRYTYTIFSFLHSVVHATMISWINWVLNVAAHFTALRPGQRSHCWLLRRSVTVPPQDGAVTFPLDYDSAVAESGPTTHHNFYFNHFCGMKNIQWIENKFLTPYGAPNNRTASESFVWHIRVKLFVHPQTTRMDTGTFNCLVHSIMDQP
jgi:hypothetical protein